MNEWFGTLPERWECKRIGALLQQRKEKNDPIQTDFILSLSAAHGVLPYSERIDKGGNKPKNDISKYNIARENDLLVNCMNILSGSCGITKWDGAISPVYYALYPRNSKEANIRYYSYIFRLITFYRSLIGISKGILVHESSTGKLNTIRLRVSMQNMNYVTLPLPHRAEQDQIVRFLDWKVTQINKLINAKKRQIELLQEQKRAMINEAVTRGGNNVQIKKVARLFSGKEVKLEVEFNENSIPVYGSGGVFKYTDRFLYNGVAVMFGRKGSIGKPIMAKGKFWAIDTMYYCVCNNRVLSKYFYYVLVDFPWHLYATKTALPSIVGTDIFNHFIQLPSIEKQKKIVDYLDTKIDEIGRTIDKITAEISLLHEYRTRLISDVVTGKMDVRGVEVPQYETVEEELLDEDDEEMEE